LLQASRRVVFLNRPAADLFISLGLDRDKAVVIPNGVADDASRPAAVGGERFLVAARLTREKGVFELAQQWPDEHLLDVAGQGPESQRIASLQKPNIRLLGQLPNDLLRQSLPEYAGIVVPSICSEMQPTIAIEAMAASVPVVAYTANVASQLVKDDDVGAIYWGAESLTAALNHVLGNQARLKDSARATFAARFSESAWTQRLVDLYSEARVQ
jgi:glycosyltransferase involved in cell wall biosynthesis